MNERQKLTDSNRWEFLQPEQWGGDANTLTPRRLSAFRNIDRWPTVTNFPFKK